MKKKYTKPKIEVVHVENNFLLSGSDGNILHDSNAQIDSRGPETGKDEELGGGEDLEGAKMNYWLLEDTILNY